MLLLKSTTETLQVANTAPNGVTALDVSVSYRDTLPGTGGSTMPSMVGYAYLAEGQSGTSLTVSPDSSITSGMWMILVLETYSGTGAGIVTDPSGWTVLQPSTTTAGSLTTAIYAKPFVTGETSYSIAMTAGGVGSSLTLMWGDGADVISNWQIGTNMFRASITPTTSTNNVAPSITTTVANTLVLAISSERTTATETAITSMTGATPWFFGAQPDTTQLETISVGYIGQTVAGATGNVTIVYPNTQASNGMAIQIAIPPISGSSSTTTSLLSSNETKITAVPATTSLPSMVGYTYTSAGVTATAITVSPDGTIAAGMWMIMVMSTYTPSVTITDPTGWTILQPQTVTAGTLLTVIYAKQFVAGETSYTITTNTGANGSNLTLMWFSGADVVSNWILGANMLRANITPTTSTNNVAPSLTTTTSNTLVLAISTERTTATETAITSMSGATPWFFGAQPNASQLETISVGYINQVATGATGDVTIVYPNAQASNGMAIQIAIPSGSSGTGLGIATTTVLPAPTTSTTRLVKIVSIANAHATAANSVTVQKNIGGTNFNLTSTYLLQPGEMIMYVDGIGWKYHSSFGPAKANQTLLSANDSLIQVNNGGTLTGNHTWNTVALPSTGWFSSAFSQDGSQMIVGAYNGSTPAYTSTDSGQSWTATTGLLLKAVTTSNDGTRLGGVNGNGGFYSSTNAGGVWVNKTFPVAGPQFSLGSSADGMKLVAAGNAGTVYVSADIGVTWTATSLATGTWTVVSSADGVKLAAASGSGTISTSTNSGTSWTSQVSSGSRAWIDLVSSMDGSVLAGVASTTSVYISYDSGVTWATRTGPGQTLTMIAMSSDGKTLLVGAGAAGSYLYLSTDSGVTWIQQAAAGAQAWTSISMSYEGTKMIATTNSTIYYSVNSAPVWNAATQTLSLLNQATIDLSDLKATPAVPAAGLSFFARSISGKSMMSKLSPSGDNEAIQSSVWQNAASLWTPGPTATGTWWGMSGSTTGTIATVATATTNVYTAMRRSTFSSVVTTTNQQIGITSDQIFLRGATAGQGGFLFVCRFGFDKIASGMRAFVGMTGNGNMVNADPSTVSSICGFGFDLADNAFTFMHNASATTATKEPISGQGTLATNNTGYDAYIWCSPNSPDIHYRLDRTDTGATLVDSVVSSNLPLNTQLLFGIAYMSNGTANTAVGAASLGINRMYLESNR